MTHYEQQVRSLRPLTLDKAISLSESLLPIERRATPWRFVNHGVDLAYDENWLLAYMAAYGEMHEVKCKAAMQNLPFNDMLSNMEIIDWGCGQGLATMIFMEMLAERQKSHLVRKITLIEPSQAALQRAQLNVSCCANESIKIVALQKYLPSGVKGNEHREILSVDGEMPCVVHLFSNILDIPTIDIKTLSEIVSNCAHKHTNNFVICMGPRNQNSFRIRQFSGFFHEKTMYSEIDSYQYAYTKKTCHNISCRTSTFSFVGDGSHWDGENDYSQYHNRQASWDYEDDYSPVGRLFKNQFPQELLATYEAIDNQLDEGDKLFLKPCINGDTPDLVLFKKNCGIAIIQIYYGNSIPPENNCPKDKDLNEVIYNLEAYSRRLINLHIESLKEKMEIEGAVRSVIKGVVVCPNLTAGQLAPLGKIKKFQYIGFVGSDRIASHFKRDARIDYNNRHFTNDLRDAFRNAVSTPWHSYREGQRLTLTATQMRLVGSRASARQKVKGHAGAGKTQVMAWRAVNAMVRTGKPILVLTFNITLRNYIRYRIQQIPADFTWSNITILNYHEFFNSQALNVGKKVEDLSAYAQENYFEGCRRQSDTYENGLSQYAAIFIDEVQDYESSWLAILQKYFLEQNGEFVVFGDKTQNVYGRKLDRENEISVPHVPGRWNEIKGRIARFQSVKISRLTQRFSERFLDAEFDNEQRLDFDDDSIRIEYCHVSSEEAKKKCGSWSLGIIKQRNLNLADTAIIASTCGILREVEGYLNDHQIETKTTFLSKELFDKAKQQRPSTLQLIDRSISHSKKLHFTTDCEQVKLSTIYSFKGWEADNIILFIQKPEKGQSHNQVEEKDITEAPVRTLQPAVIYTAITRPRKKLFIINIENDKYHQFFSENL